MDSIRGIGITDPEKVKALDKSFFMWQMAGMLFGGLLWGILGDKHGRKSVLFGSIFLYSAANIANAFVGTVEAYQWVRFIAGLGLAGELGAAITLISEVMHKEHRGYGTMIIVTMGAFGAVAAANVAKANMNFWGMQSWQWAYIIGGVLGLVLLLLRVGTFESGMFDKVKEQKVSRGNFFMLFTDRKRFLKYLACIAVGLPVWYVVGILVKFSSGEFRYVIDDPGISSEIIRKNGIMYCYIGLSIGDLLSGWLSQILRSRKLVILGFLILTAALSAVFLYGGSFSLSAFNMLCIALGAGTGYWALFVTVASEQFGTNIRSTVTTTVPNFVRGAVIPITLSFKAMSDTSDPVHSAVIVGVVCIGLAIVSTLFLKDTFGKDLDYLEMS